MRPDNFVGGGVFAPFCDVEDDGETELFLRLFA
jgi:hypothetical protein